MCHSARLLCDSFGLAKQLASSVYEANSPPGSNTCEGEACFRTTFLVCAFLGFFATALAALVWLRLRGKAAAEAKVRVVSDDRILLA